MRGFRFARGLIGLVSGAVVATVANTVAGFGVGGGGVWHGMFWVFGCVAVGSPLWYWIGRPLYVWRVGESGAVLFRLPGTRSDNRTVRYGSVTAYSLTAIILSVLVVTAATGAGAGAAGGPTQLQLGEEASTQTLAASVIDVATTDRIVSSPRTAGGPFVLIQFEITNIGDSHQRVPSPTGVLFPAEIEMEYNGETVTPIRPGPFSADQVSYESYHTVSADTDYTIAPGDSVSGWVVFRLTDGSAFNREFATVRIELGSRTQVYEWSLGRPE
ncbi:MAG: hypothetical protein J07HQW1_02172 [Haloquadratum walsbyi J07HQW1]|uniref:DUF4352 domain-containing protein n=1 Tax=Haloquadratum walsbyi J07HQW1 TaxID=1238424 RepID=U1PET6_9EURY|nr:MAG: hypothetical protein J07HQW1_02172 [Haloquadratum walsbyi J07HQW1]